MFENEINNTEKDEDVKTQTEMNTEESKNAGSGDAEDPKKKSKWGRIFGSAAAFGLIAGLVFTGVSYAGNKATGSNRKIATTNTVKASAVSSTTAAKTAGGMDVTAIANSVMPAMVKLNGTERVRTSGYGNQTYEANTSGTGIIVGKNDKELLVLTNAHVVESTEKLQCEFIDGKTVSAAIKGSNANEDVAVVAIKLSDISDDTMSKIAVAQLNDNENAATVGQQVVAIGNARGEGQSVTVGYVSAVNRSISVNNVQYTGLILTDAAINSGNSGGALINSQGQVIGINFAKDGSSGVENMAYSIPIAKVKDLINSLMNQKTRNEVSGDKAAYLGIAGVDITSEMSKQYGYPTGLLLRTVEEGSPAEKAGLSAYDVITTFDNKSVTTLTNLQNTLKYYKSGETVKIGYYHIEGNKYVQKTTEVTLGSRK